MKHGYKITKGKKIGQYLERIHACLSYWDVIMQNKNLKVNWTQNFCLGQDDVEILDLIIIVLVCTHLQKMS